MLPACPPIRGMCNSRHFPTQWDTTANWIKSWGPHSLPGPSQLPQYRCYLQEGLLEFTKMFSRPMLLSRACSSYCLPLAAVMTARRIWPLTEKVWSLQLAPERPSCKMEQALNRVKLRCRSQRRTVGWHLMSMPHCLSPLYATLLVMHGSEALLMPDLFGIVVDRKALLGQQLGADSCDRITLAS